MPQTDASAQMREKASGTGGGIRPGGQVSEGASVRGRLSGHRFRCRCSRIALVFLFTPSARNFARSFVKVKIVPLQTANNTRRINNG